MADRKTDVIISKYMAMAEKYLFPILLLLYPFIGFMQGADVTDTTYSLSNYMYQDNLDNMWMLATYIPNVIGHALTLLPYGDTLMGMNFYTTFVICGCALTGYFFLKKWMPGLLAFVGEFIACSLCWCPRVILYNYLTYLLLTAGTLCLIYAVKTHKNGLLFVAGLLLGLNVMVRFPNATECLLIMVVWFCGAIDKRKTADITKQTLICIVGYIAGIAIPMLAIMATYGINAYADMISGLFGMTGGASDYTPAGMLMSIAGAYGATLSKMAIMIPCIAAGIVLFAIGGRNPDKKNIRLKKIVYIAGLLILVRYYFAKGVFTRNYYYYDSMFQAGMMLLIIGICLCIAGAAGCFGRSSSDRIMPFAALILIAIIPIGSNNYTFPLINCLFIIAPVILKMFYEILKRVKRMESEKRLLWFPAEAMITAVIIVLVVQGCLFHINYSFSDGADGQIRDTRLGRYGGAAEGMMTTAANAKAIEGLGEFIIDNNLTEHKVILFGKIPGISFIYHMESEIWSVWPDLDSNTVAQFRQEIDSVPDSSDALIIVHDDIEGEVLGQEKLDILMDYIEQGDYNNVFSNEYYTVYALKHRD